MVSPFPSPQGLYTGTDEHDACGVGLVANLSGEPTRAIVEQAITVLVNLDHRGASGSDPDSGDGAGILIQVPDEFLRAVVTFDLPAAGSYAVGMAFFENDDAQQEAGKAAIARVAEQEGLQVLGWREVPVTEGLVGAAAAASQPRFSQLFVADAQGGRSGIELDRLAFCLRKRAEREVGVYFASLSARTVVYKGMLTTSQLEPFFPDLSDSRMKSALGLVHSRFSTNTFPSWPLAHPYRLIAHNGEINTVNGNRNWMRAREANLRSDVIPGDLSRLFPICTDGGSDSASFDEVLELLH